MSDDADDDDHMPAVLKASIGVLQALVEDLEAQLVSYELAFEPVLWICQMTHCGAPNETPRIQFPGPHNTLVYSLKCATCGCVQDYQVMKTFL